MPETQATAGAAETSSPPGTKRQPPLRRIGPEGLTVTRHRAGRGFIYRDESGRRVTGEAELARFRALAIPPAYVDVRLARDPRAHLQAIGRDEAGRIQHRYHPDWDKVRERRKLGRLARLIEALPRLRQTIARDLSSRRPDKTKALACAAALIDRCHIRVGNETYAKTNGSYGASTLLKRHVEVSNGRVALSFRGKSGKAIACARQDPALARAIARLAALPGRRLFQYRDDAGAVGVIRAAEVNAYLRQAAGLPISSKDLRMLAANAAAAELLLASDVAVTPARQKRRLAEIMRAISERLVNTPAVVRKSYVHAIVVSAYASGRLGRAYRSARRGKGCTRIERALGALAR